MDYEIVQSHDLVDRYRLRDGLILEVNKYKRIGRSVVYDNNLSKVVRGCKDLRELKSDFYDNFYNESYKSGSYLYKGVFIEEVDNDADFSFEIRCSGGLIIGDKESLNSVLKDVLYILNSYGGDKNEK